MTADNPTVRPWQEIARELAEQTDLEKVRELSHELNEALDMFGNAGANSYSCRCRVVTEKPRMVRVLT